MTRTNSTVATSELDALIRLTHSEGINPCVPPPAVGLATTTVNSGNRPQAGYPPTPTTRGQPQRNPKSRQSPHNPLPRSRYADRKSELRRPLRPRHFALTPLLPVSTMRASARNRRAAALSCGRSLRYPPSTDPFRNRNRHRHRRRYFLCPPTRKLPRWRT